METVCIILVAFTCFCCDRVLDVEDTELIVTYVQGINYKLETNVTAIKISNLLA